MTSKQFRALSPEQQRITVAELAGWRRQGLGFPCFWFHPRLAPAGCDTITNEYEDQDKGLPDYLRDLNAMHEVELAKLTSLSLRSVYASNLWLICEGYKSDYPEMYATLSATAAQRAEAFVVTLTKGKE